MSTAFPSTPSPQRVYSWNNPGDSTHRPMRPSPLASPSSPTSSPVSAAQSRRRSQYKAKSPATPLASSSRFHGVVRSASLSGGSVFGSGGSGGGIASPIVEDAHRDMIRERFKARCLQRAKEARDRSIKQKRYEYNSSDSIAGSDDTVMDEDEGDDDDDEDILQDELFRRIMNNAARKSQHSYRVSYAQDVGSSFDPDMEDVAAWEQELHTSERLPDFPALSPNDLLDEEISAYAEEQAALADFQDLDIDELLAWSDAEEDLSHLTNHGMEVDSVH
ncbi:hypothetical protein PC9H_010856 [Pleurotus ostreatus]|uniref:Uncharacterized protein n=2 Tax=Pleurotus TaxID=5320 RepID=A0A8H7DQ40_PLEOS|nr:uncharacterized protein PC9H_010856 [Pleurotus ostreatus]KAF7422700.1 hypothetical protein PC9H_010856 [Pleurotus ostreatus]KAG9227452.1 hypothetical protein CCMSSC00406_0000902 [Pleurotus cornucopiae]